MKSKCKIIHIVPSLETGGMENGVVNLVNNLDPLLFSFSICCLKKEGSLKGRLKKDIAVHCLNKQKGISLFTFLKLTKIIRQEKADIVHTHGWGGGALYGIISAKLSGTPIIINGEHGTLFDQTKIRRIAQKFLSWFIDVIITVSDDLKQDLINKMGINQKKIQTIINGVDTVKFRPDESLRTQKRIELGLKDEILIGTVGRLVPVKDYQTLIKAAAQIMGEKGRDKISLVLIGDGSCRKELENTAKALNIEDKVHFLGEKDDVPSWLNAMDIFVLSSLDEGLSNTILEAMAVGKAVVATRVGGNSEIIRDKETGLLSPVGDVETLAGILTDLIENPLKIAGLGANARKSTENEFSLQFMVKNYEQVYKRCLERIKE